MAEVYAAALEVVVVDCWEDTDGVSSVWKYCGKAETRMDDVPPQR